MKISLEVQAEKIVDVVEDKNEAGLAVSFLARVCNDGIKGIQDILFVNYLFR